MTDARPTRHRRRLVLILLLGAGAWVVATRRRPSAVPASSGVVPAASRPGPAPAVPGGDTAPAPLAGAATPDAAAAPAVTEPAVTEPAAAGPVNDGAPARRRPSPTPRAATPSIRPLASPAAESLPAPVARPPSSPLPSATARPPAAQPFGPGSVAPLPDGSAPAPEFTIKGNAGSMLFHLPSSPYYGRTKAEVWFRTPEDASAAGFTAYVPRRKGRS